jgi:hypothetical protein
MTPVCRPAKTAPDLLESVSVVIGSCTLMRLIRRIRNGLDYRASCSYVPGTVVADSLPGGVGPSAQSSESGPARMEAGMPRSVGRFMLALAALVFMRRRRCNQEPMCPDHSRPPEPSNENGESTDKTDQAALMGAAVAAIFALVLSPGEYGWLEVVTGTTLGVVILGYYRFPSRHLTWRDALTKAAALGAVGALCLSLSVALPLQNLLEGHGSGHYCITIQNQKPDRVQMHPKYVPVDYYDCLGDEVNERLPLIWVMGAFLIGVPAFVKLKIKDRSSKSSPSVAG